MITYEYEKDVYDINRLVDEIRNSSITIALDHVSVFGNQLSIVFKLEISVDEKIILDGIIASHTGEPLPVDEVSNVNIIEQPEPQPFALPTYRTKNDATNEKISVNANDVGNVDYKLLSELYVSGGSIVIKNAKLGDYITACVYDVDEVIPLEYRAILCENWPCVATYITKQWVEVDENGITVHRMDTRPLNAKITTGLHLRVSYNAVNEGVTREVLVNYNLTKKL